MSTMKKKGLGRGLEVLLGSPAEIVEVVKQDGAPTVLKLEQMQPGKYQRARAWTRARCRNWPPASARRG